MRENSFCDLSVLEIKEMKKRVLDMLTRSDDLKSGKPTKFFAYRKELEEMIREIEAKIDQYQRECRFESDSRGTELGNELLDLKNKYREFLSKIPSEAFIG
jgi:hypothetical protein